MRIIVLFNLREGVDVKTYEDWAKASDIPTVRSLPSVTGFRVSAATGLLGGGGPSPYQYVEVIDVADMDQFGKDISKPEMQKVAAQYQSFVEMPYFILTREIDV